MTPTRTGRNYHQPSPQPTTVTGQASGTADASATESRSGSTSPGRLGFAAVEQFQGLPRRRQRSESFSEAAEPQALRPRLSSPAPRSNATQYVGQATRQRTHGSEESAELRRAIDAIAFSGEPSGARERLATFHAQAAQASRTYVALANKASRNGTTGVQVSSVLNAEAATQSEVGLNTQTIMINPTHRRPTDPEQFALTPAVMRSRMRVSLLCEIANAAEREQFDEVDRRAESGELDLEASRMVLGSGERKLLAQGHRPVAVLYAREFERVEFECVKRAAQAAGELRDAGLLAQDDPELLDLLAFAQMPFPEAFDRMVEHGHTQKYIDQFEQYVDEDELRTPTEEDFRSPTPPSGS